MSDFIIIGGGISGLLIARELASHGAAITILEQNRIGQEASWAGGGILSPLYPWRQPLPINALCHWSQQQYPLLSQQLQQNTNIDPEWTRCGMLWLSLPDLDDALSWCRNTSTNATIFSGEAVEEVQKGLGDGLSGTHLWLPDIAQIRNPRLLKALKRDLRQRQVKLIEQSQVTEWVITGNQATDVKTTQQTFSADNFIVTAGAWSSRVLSNDNLWQPVIHPVKGQMLLFKSEPGLLQTMVQCGEHYLIPRRDGRILAGSTVEESGFDKRPTTSGYRQLHQFAIRTLPALKDCPVELHWAGIRPGSPDGIPYIGAHPQINNVFFNCGHFRNGVVMGPAAARLLADIILQRPSFTNPEPFLPSNR